MSKTKIISISSIIIIAVGFLAAKLLASSASSELTVSSECNNPTYIIKPKIEGDIVISGQDSSIFSRYAETAISGNWSQFPIGDIIALTGEFFKGKEYVAYTLDKNPDEEHLVVNMQGMDCSTFVETCLALANCVKNEQISISDFENELCRIRYRHGIMNGYASRLHYLSDWIRDNQYKGVLKDITEEIGGTRLDKSINYMSTHPERYAALKNGGLDLERIRAIEKDLSRTPIYYIPRNKLSAETYKKIKTGDIICFTTDAKGLDYAHVGFAFKDSEGIVHFMHESLSIGHVLVTERSLIGYMSNKKHFTGITVLRAN